MNPIMIKPPLIMPPPVVPIYGGGANDDELSIPDDYSQERDLKNLKRKQQKQEIEDNK